MFIYKYGIVTCHPYRYWKVNSKLMGAFTKHYFPACIPHHSFIQELLLGCLLYFHEYCKDRHLPLRGPASHGLKREGTVAVCDAHAGNTYNRRPSACVYQIHLQTSGCTVARMSSEIWFSKSGMKFNIQFSFLK